MTAISAPNDYVNLTEVLEKDFDGSKLKELVNLLLENENMIRAYINQGLSKEEFQIQESLLEASKLATAYIQKFWQLKHKN